MKMYFALFLMHTLALLLIDVFIFPIWSYVAHRDNAAFPWSSEVYINWKDFLNMKQNVHLQKYKRAETIVLIITVVENK